MLSILQWCILFALSLSLDKNQAFNTNGIDICHFPTRYNYPCETHSIVTRDGYILSTIRIPYSRRKEKKSHTSRGTKKPVVLLMHGLAWSSHCWLIADPRDSLAYTLADTGYDVWLTNSRGSHYSRNHTSKSISSASFWDFSFHEIGVYDIPAVINYILWKTKQRSLHYVGHSQGTSAFLVWLSSYPQESVKIKSSHLLAPVAFMDHMQLASANFLADILGHPTEWTNTIANIEILSRNTLFDALPQVCSVNSPKRQFCLDLFFGVVGQSEFFNKTLLPDLLTNSPSSSSLHQLVHYLQEYVSGHFRQYDYGREKNLQIYSSPYPPDYKVEWIKTPRPINMYYGDGDILVSPIDVHRLAKKMSHTVDLHRVLGGKFGHFDFVMGIKLKELINDCVRAKIAASEGRSYKGKACCNLSSKWHCTR